MFFGKNTLLLSEENQFALPPLYLDAMGNVAYVTQGFDRNLYILSEQVFTAIYSQVKATSISDPLARLLRRLFLGGAEEISIDQSGNIKLPVNLCEYAGISKEILLVGQGEYLELWSPSLWQRQLDSLNDYDANVQRFEKFHISLA
jgi:MraZ protein